MSPITFILFAYNEEKRIAFAIRNLISYGPVLVLDGGSTDRTKEIAEELGATFHPRPASDKPNSETQQNFEFVKSLIKTDWIYWGYVDNIAPKALLEKMVNVAAENKFKKVVLPMRTFLWGNTEHAVLESHAPMLFHKDFTTFVDNHIHGMGQFTGTADQVLTLPITDEYSLRHFSTYTTEKFVAGHMRYAVAEAHEKFAAGKKFSTVRMIAAMLRYWWIYRKSLRLGRLGIITLLSYSFFRLMAYAKLYELENGISLEGIEDSYGKAKESMLDDFDK